MGTGASRSFHLEACLGRGGFGEVYRARMARPGGFETLVAVKVLRHGVDLDGQAGRRLRDEARLLGIVRHAAIPRLLDLVELEGHLALVSEYVEGEDLSHCLRADPPLGPRACVEALGQVADALHAAWHVVPPGSDTPARIVHRDLKPANLRVAREGRIKLLDFGIAYTDSVTRIAETQTSAIVGSPAYMAPERFDGLPPSAANDVFSLGAVLYECLTGTRLFSDMSFKTLAAVSLFEDRFTPALDVRLEMLPDDTDPVLLDWLARMLAWSPQARPTADAIAEAFEDIAPRLPGPSLAAWCRARVWPPEPTRQGPWTGRTLHEDTASPIASLEIELEPLTSGELSTLTTGDLELATPTTVPVPVPPRDVAPEAPSATRWPWIAGVVLLLALVATGLATRSATALAPPDALVDVVPPPIPAATIEAPADDPPPAVETPVAVEPAPPEPAPDTTPAPAPRKRVPVTRAPEPSPEPAPAAVARIAPRPAPVVEAARVPVAEPEPMPVATAPTPVAEPAPRAAAATPVPTATGPEGTMVRIDPASGVAGAWLQGDELLVKLPSRVAPGHYTILVETTPGVPRTAGALDVGDTPVIVRCSLGLCRDVPAR